MSKMKYFAATALLFSAFGAQAAGVTGCDGTQTVAKSGVLPFGASGTPVASPTFVNVGFAVSCSANVNLQYDEVSANSFAVASGSKKGNQAYKGNSAAGGTIIVDAACDKTAGCTTEVGTALTAAKAMGSS